MVPSEPLGASIGVWASDQITMNGIMALLPEAGYHPVAAADADTIDVLIISSDTALDARIRELIAAADARGIPVVWLQNDRERGVLRPELRAHPGPSSHLVQLGQEAGLALVEALRAMFSVSTDIAADVDADQPPTLPTIEREVLRLLADGQDTAEIAARMFYSERTVKNAISRAVRLLGATNRSNAVALALRRGYL